MASLIGPGEYHVNRSYSAALTPEGSSTIIRVMLPRIQPINPSRIGAPFDHDDWIFEWKADGWRCMAYVENDVCELVSRNGNVYKSFARLTKELAALPVKSAIIDAEVVVLDPEGKSVFHDLMNKRRAVALLYAFDLLYQDGHDLRQLPLLERKKRLKHLIQGHPGLMYADHIAAKGVDLFQLICEMDLEGIVCKHKLTPYVSRPQVWFKVVNPNYSQHRARREMFEKFRTPADHVTAD